MEVERSRSGFFTVSFRNTQKLSDLEIGNMFESAGKVCGISSAKDRVFIRYKHKHEAVKALDMFGKSLDVKMALNKDRISDTKEPVPSSGEEQENKPSSCQTSQESTKKSCRQAVNMAVLEFFSSEPAKLYEKLTTRWEQVILNNEEYVLDSYYFFNVDENYHLILSNLPNIYTIEEVKSLVDEAHPLAITNLYETKAFHTKFCHVVLESEENLSYLINKLHGFVISGQKLIAVEAKNLLKWKRENF